MLPADASTARLTTSRGSGAVEVCPHPLLWPTRCTLNEDEQSFLPEASEGALLLAVRIASICKHRPTLDLKI